MTEDENVKRFRAAWREFSKDGRFTDDYYARPKLNILVCEEYDYAQHDFVFWGTKEELILQWKDKKARLLDGVKLRTLHTLSNKPENQVAQQIHADHECGHIDPDYYDAYIVIDQDEESGLYFREEFYPSLEQNEEPK